MEGLSVGTLARNRNCQISRLTSQRTLSSIVFLKQIFQPKTLLFKYIRFTYSFYDSLKVYKSEYISIMLGIVYCLNYIL
jgi:hypothetical protein